MDQYNRTSFLRQQFQEFHHRHPEVYEWVVYFALEMKTNGRRKYGMKSIIERVRWHIDMNGPKDDREGNMLLKINNNHAPFYSRLVMEQEPCLKGFFEIREQSHERN